MKKKSLLYSALVTLPFYLLLAACGGGGSSSLPTADTTKPIATPANNGIVTTGQRALVVNFNETIFGAAQSVPDSTNVKLTLKGSSTSILGIPDKTLDNQITFYLDRNEKLVVNVDYELTLSGLFDSANNPLQTDNAANYVWSFRVSDYQILKINKGVNSVAQQPKYSSNVSNEVIAAWVEKSDTTYFLYASIYSNNNWSAPQEINSTPLRMRINDVSSNGLGFAVAWTDNSNIYASVYNNGSWVSSQQLSITNVNSSKLSSTYQNITSPAPNIAGEGYAITWLEGGSIYARIYSGFNWAAETIIGKGSFISNLNITSNGRGYAVSWMGDDSSAICVRGTQVFANVYSTATGWAKLVLEGTQIKYPRIISAGIDTITANTTKSAQQGNLVSDGNSYLFYWYAGDQTNNGSFVYATVFTQLDIETGQPQFDGPFKISNIGNVTNLQAASNGAGYALTWEATNVVVANLNQSNTYLFANHYNYPTKNARIGQWQQPLVISDPAAIAEAGSTAIAGSSAGYAIVWQQKESDTTVSLKSRVLINKSTWSDIIQLSGKKLGTLRPGRASIISTDNRYSVMWLQGRNNNTGNNDVYLNQFDGANWQTTATPVSSTPIAYDFEKVKIVNQATTLLALWTQNKPNEPAIKTQQLLSKQILYVPTSNIDMIAANPPLTTLTGLSEVGRDTNYVYANNTNSLAVFNIDSNGKTLIPVDAQTGTLTTIENYTVTASSAPATDSLGVTVFVATTANQLNAYPVNPKTGELSLPKSISIGASNNIAIVTHPNKFVYVLSRSIDSNISSVIKVFQYFANTQSLVRISDLANVPTNTFNILANPSDLIIHPSGKYLYVTSQANKSIGIYTIDTTGKLTKITDHPVVVPPRDNVILESLAISNDGKYLYLSDQAALRILSYTINNDGTLSANPNFNDYKLDTGGTTFDVVTHPSGKYLYSFTGQSIQSFKINAFTGALTFINSYNNINNGGVTTLSSIKGLAVSPDGKQIYITDSTNSALYIFDINQLNDINNNRIPGGLYSPGQAAPGNSVQNGQGVTASKAGRCEVQLP